MSFSFNQQNVQIWGVMNITPNSFSDGGDLTSAESLREKLSVWLPWIDGVDIGAESTAPHNTAITSSEERKRLETTLVPMLKSWPKNVVLSLDSYQIPTVEWLLSLVPQDVQLVWNDVSGQLDLDAIRLLKQHSKLRYVLSYNPIPTRTQTNAHMDYVKEGSAAGHARQFFREKFETLLREDLFSRVIADPCFGFAKNREQNQKLLQELPMLMEELACPHWMWGVSRKSFMRFPADANPKDPAIQSELDGRALLWTKMALEKLRQPHTIILRTHAPLLSRGLQGWTTLENVWNKNS
jgi:dihydropteroate synthase